MKNHQERSFHSRNAAGCCAFAALRAARRTFLLSAYCFQLFAFCLMLIAYCLSLLASILFFSILHYSFCIIHRILVTGNYLSLTSSQRKNNDPVKAVRIPTGTSEGAQSTLAAVSQSTRNAPPKNTDAKVSGLCALPAKRLQM